MGTRLDMIFYGHSVEEGHRLAKFLLEEIRRLELLMSRYREDSPVWIVNKLAGKKSLSLNHELFEILQTCEEYHERT